MCRSRAGSFFQFSLERRTTPVATNLFDRGNAVDGPVVDKDFVYSTFADITLGATTNQAIMAINILVFMAVSDRFSVANMMGLMRVTMRARAPMILGRLFISWKRLKLRQLS